MASYPVEIRRCGHIRSNGTQCGSPALKEKEFCYYHQQNRPRMIDYFLEGEDGPVPAGHDFILPVLEDAHSIQTALRQILQLLLQQRIDRKDAGLALYALQIASGNLKRMQEEKPKPTHVVVEPEKVAETPMGMTPWSETGEGHDPEESEEEHQVTRSELVSVIASLYREPDPEADQGLEDDLVKLKDYIWRFREDDEEEEEEEEEEDDDDEENGEDEEEDDELLPVPERLCSCLEPEEAEGLRKGFVKAGLIEAADEVRYRAGVGDDPLLELFEQLCAGETVVRS